ncbi:MAG: hypothetical protein RBT30_01645 [Patescibacteria group bacterium]|jgi:DNA-binding transcriptional regulator YhcF (GntR family)|nr:hypothetical protein [Patescibacteria group bacterium]
MLEQLFGSKARVRLLKAFLSRPEQKYYTRQLSRDLDLQVNSVRRELENLKHLGIIKESDNEDEVIDAKKNDKKYYCGNTDFLLFHELKKLFSKSNLLSCQEFLEEFKEDADVKLLLLSGIFTGDTQSLSDILIVGTIKKQNFLRKLKNLEDDLAKEINYTIMDEAEYNYRLDIHDIFLHAFQSGQVLEVVNRLDEE